MFCEIHLNTLILTTSIQSISFKFFSRTEQRQALRYLITTRETNPSTGFACQLLSQRIVSVNSNNIGERENPTNKHV